MTDTEEFWFWCSCAGGAIIGAIVAATVLCLVWPIRRRH